MKMKIWRQWTGRLSVAALLVLLATDLLFARIILASTVKKLPPELKELRSLPVSYEKVSAFFKALAQKKGGAYAYKVLTQAPPLPGVDIHLVAHVIGDELYKQQGARGIQVCTHDFQNACSHAIVIGLFSDFGEGALSQIADVCRSAPGGSGAYGQCFHGLGHGVLAYLGYDLPKAIASCKKTGTAQKHYLEYTNCVGGAVMEIVGGGFHDRELFLKQQAKFLPKNDPLAPCTSAFMPADVRSQCYVFLTPRLISEAGASRNSPNPRFFEKAFSFCNLIPLSEKENRFACFGAFGKEFVVLARGHDVSRNSIDHMTDDALATSYRWCQFAHDQQAILACNSYAIGSLYWGGENSYSTPVRYCDQIDDKVLQGVCFNNMTAAVASFHNEPDYRKNYCQSLPLPYQSGCRSVLGVQD